MTLRELLTDEPTTIYFKAQTSEETPLGTYSWDGEKLTPHDAGEYTLEQEIVGWVWGDGEVVVYVEPPVIPEPEPVEPDVEPEEPDVDPDEESDTDPVDPEVDPVEPVEPETPEEGGEE